MFGETDAQRSVSCHGCHFAAAGVERQFPHFHKTFPTDIKQKVVYTFCMNTLWYKKPAADRTEALPLGNGRLGALVYGKMGHEVIELSEESLWSRPYSCRDTALARKSLKDVRDLIKKNRIAEAQELMLETFTGTPEKSGHYCSAGKVHIDFYNSESYGLSGPSCERNSLFANATTYRRELDLETGIATTTFSKDMDVQNTAYLSKNAFGSSITYTREAFVSASSNVIVYHCSASTPKSIFFRVNLEHSSVAKSFSLTDDTIGISVTDGIPFSVLATVSASGGKVFVRGNYLIVEGADEATLFVDVQTAFRKGDYFATGGNVNHRLFSLATWCADRALKNICFGLGAEYQTLKKEHMRDFAPLLKEAELSIGDEPSYLPSVEELLENLKPGSANFDLLSELYWNYSRYLFVSSSRTPGSLPSLKDGIWFNDCEGKEERYEFFPGTEEVLSSFEAGLFTSVLPDDKNLFGYIKRLYKNGKHTAQKMFDMDGSLVFTSSDVWGDSSVQGSDFTKSFWPMGTLVLALLVRDRFEFTQDKKFLKKYFYIMKGACEFFSQYMTLSDDGSRLVVSPMVSAGYDLSDGSKAFVREGSAEDTALVAELFDATIQCALALGLPLSGNEIAQYQAMLSRLNPSALCGKKKNAFTGGELTSLNANLMGNNFSTVRAFTESIISSVMKEGRVVLEVLSDAPSVWKKGKLTGISLRGNIFADVSWADGRIESARVYAKQGTVFVRDLTVIYQGKSYETRLAENSLDLLNVLPSTV